MSSEAANRVAESDAAAVLGPSRIVLGGPFGAESEQDSRRRLETFREAGGTVVETAFSYRGGRAMAAVGAWLADRPGALDVLIKIGHDAHGDDMPLTAENVIRDLDEARRVLHVETVGVALLHNDDPRRSVAEIATTLARLVETGRARSVGASNWSAERLDELVDALRELGHTPLASYHLSLAEADPVGFRGSTLPGDRAVHDVVRRQRLPLLSWSANAGGYFARDDAGADGDPFDGPASRGRRERCRVLAASLGTDAASVALGWTLARPSGCRP